MTDVRTTNQKIADLLQEQTYNERMELADWLRDILNDMRAEMSAEQGFDAADLAGLLSSWAETEIEEAGA